MTTHDDAIADARRQALLVHAQQVHLDAFNSTVHRTRASDKQDPMTVEQAKAVQDAETASRKVLGRLARNNGSTPAKALADATDAYESNLRANLASWESELVVVLDMIAHPDEYGHKLLDGRPMDAEQLTQGVVALRAVIAQARSTLGVEDEAKRKR